MSALSSPAHDESVQRGSRSKVSAPSSQAHDDNDSEVGWLEVWFLIGGEPAACSADTCKSIQLATRSAELSTPACIARILHEYDADQLSGRLHIKGISQLHFVISVHGLAWTDTDATSSQLDALASCVRVLGNFDDSLIHQGVCSVAFLSPDRSGVTKLVHMWMPTFANYLSWRGCGYVTSKLLMSWQEGRVKEVLANKLKSASGARTLTNCPLFLRALHPHVLDRIAIPILSDHNVHGAWIVGKTRRGKSQLARLCGFTISAANILKDSRTDLTPSITQAKHVDFGG